MDIANRTLSALDWPFVLDALASNAKTSAGARAARELRPTTDIADIEETLDAVGEIAELEDDGTGVPVGGVEDIDELLIRAARGESLDLEELRLAAGTVVAADDLARFADRNRQTAPTVAAWSTAIDIDASLRNRLERAFDERGQLSEKAYPKLGELRRRIPALEQRVRTTLDELMRNDAFAGTLQDRYYTQRGDRYVVPVKSDAKRYEMGVVHDTSRTGQTVFLEPHQVVPISNRLRIAEAELDAEQRRILADLSRELGSHRTALGAALRACTRIDLACARRRFAQRMGAHRPQIGREGIVRLIEARHPVLVLRGVKVTPNDLKLDGVRRVLIVTGPNAGGKTVALKTIGLCALLVRIGCPVPANEGSRVDVFDEVLADIGDQQTVHDDLSSFSGHLAALHDMLGRAGVGTLLLLDEIAAGTDPTQGGALARALVERFADAGASIVATTHYAQLKSMGAGDERAEVVAMEYLDHVPTYRLVPGIVGESHALSAARRSGIDESVIERARTLMDEGERALHDAIAELEAERDRSREALAKAEAERSELALRERSVAQRELKIRLRADKLEEEAAAAFLERLREAERDVAKVVADLQRAPDSKTAAVARESVRSAGAVLDTREGSTSQPEAPTPVSTSTTVQIPTLSRGDRVRVKRHGLTGEVVALSGRKLTVQAGAVRLELAIEDVERLGGPSKSPQRSPRTHSRRRSASSSTHDNAFRTESNTLDLRGERVEEGLRKLDRFLDAAALANRDAIFVLHGHGTGAMKDAVRRALSESPYVSGAAPASDDQGGDAFTVAILQG